MFEEDNESFSETQSELFAGLMMIFLFIAIAFMIKTESKTFEIIKQKQTIGAVVENWAGTKTKIYEELKKEFWPKEDIDKLNSKSLIKCSTKELKYLF